MAAEHAINVASKPLGINLGGKHGTVIECPHCGKPCVLWKRGVKAGVAYADYAHSLSISLNRKNEPEMAPGDVCRSSTDRRRSASEAAK